MSSPSASSGPEPTPNAALVPDHVRSSVILCCGEDKEAFVTALAAAGLSVPATPASEFRSYTVWPLPQVTVILASIGTGSLEPLLFELLSLGCVERIVLVGTAGSLGPRRLPLGAAYPIAEAWLSGTGLDREVLDQPLRPHWPLMPSGPVAALVSSDFYYGFSPSQRPGDYRQRLPALSRDFARLSAITDLVDMEVAQFYALCRLIPEQPGLRYLAIKGASNSVENHAEQNAHAPSVLLHCLQKAILALELKS
jgi:hypothetical protein